MVEWNCNAKTTNLNEQVQHSRTSYHGDRVFGITAKLIATSRDIAAVIDVSFSSDWGDSTKRIALRTGEYEVYEDHDYVEWRVHVDKVLGDTADIQICFDDYPRAAGIIVSIDAPAEAAEGSTINLCTTIKNVGNAAGTFELRIYGPDNILHAFALPNAGVVEAGETVGELCHFFTMLADAWLGTIYIIRVEFG